jgi:adenosylcobinamide-GDP ribazoletransferase
MSSDTPHRPDGLHESLPDRPQWPGLAVAFVQCIRFYSRLPMPKLRGEVTAHSIPDFRIVPRILPLAAVLISLPAALVLWFCALIGVDSTLAATLAIAVLVLTTGAFHEDGLADTADGLFGGHTIERRLEIMKDSRIGTFGGAALVLSLLLRVTAIAALTDASSGCSTALVLVAAAGWSRSLGIKVLADDAPARAYGAAAAVGRPTRGTMLCALVLALALTILVFIIAGLPLVSGLAALVLATTLAALVVYLARRLIGGQTGDIAGAAQQLAEIGFYLGAVMALAVTSFS